MRWATQPYDDRGRLVYDRQTITSNGDVVYHFTYEYDLGGNRTKKIDVLNAIEVTYYYDITETGVLAGINNRLIYYSTDSTLGGTTTPISTTYYYYTNEANPDRIVTELANPAIGEPRFMATRFGYAANGSAVVYILGETWNEDGSSGSPLDGCVDSYTVSYAREFRYDGARQRYLNRELDPVAVQAGDMTVIVNSVWTDYEGDSAYSDFLADRDALPDDVYDNKAMYLPGIGQVTELDTVFPDASYYVTNHLGTTMDRFNQDAITMAPATYTAFGERIDTGTYERYGYAGSWGYQQHSNFEFTGSQRDDQPGDPTRTHQIFQFSHVGARYYDPAVGRFMQRDPIGIGGGANVYGYVRNKPSTRIDSAGLMPEHIQELHPELIPQYHFDPHPPPTPQQKRKVAGFVLSCAVGGWAGGLTWAVASGLLYIIGNVL